MFLADFLEFDELPPPEIFWFERLWLLSLALTVFVTIMMFDWSMSRLGPLPAALLTSTRFGGSFLLMFLCSRRRSQLARWTIAIPFNLTIVAYDVIRLPEILERGALIWVVLLRLVLIFAASYMLFTPRSRAWFARRAPLDGEGAA